MSDPKNPDDGDDILKSIRRLTSSEEEERFRCDRPEGDPGRRLVLTEDMSAEREDMPPLVLGGEASAGAAPDGTPAPRPGPAEPAMPGLDEAALREMVTGIVRDELRGALGERITSNIRKLVRREILRAQSLDEAD